MKKQIVFSALVALLAWNSSAQNPTYVTAPTTVTALGLTNVVPDMLLWYSSKGYYTNGPIANPAEQLGNLGNWEPNISVVGDAVFLIGANTFADDGQAGPTGNQRFAVTFQPVGGGKPKIGDHFFADNGAPFRGQVNLSRQNGNPQRVAGDKRPGATNVITMAESSAGQLPPFQADRRWTNNLMYQADNRYVTEQLFSLNLTTLTQSPAAKAWDYVYGPLVTSTTPGGGNQLSRTGGTAAGLDNGNFVIVIDDKTTYSSSAGEVTTLAIVSPSGQIVKTNTLVDARDIWDNVCAYSGGFAIRVHDLLYFFDNAGNPKFTNSIVTSSGLPFGTGREDGSRIASDIRSHYVYLAGETPETSGHNPCSLAVFDARTGQLVATNEVTDTDPAVHTMGRVNLAVDAADDFCVVWSMSPDTTIWAKQQVVARVGRFTGTNVTWLSPSFFPFINSDSDPNNVLGLTTVNPSVAMTTRHICIAAKGTVNSTNNPTGGPDTLAETTLYTVINQPFLPGSIESVGLKRIVPDTPVIVPAADALGNWEPYTSVLGNSTFLIEGNTFATNDPANQRYVVYFQPATGGPGKLGDGFFSDDGKPFRDQVNLSRQNGNPGRVAGDKRPGAVNFLTAAEASCGQLAPFQSTTRTADPFRWDRNPIYGGGDASARYVSVEVFSLNPATLAQTPLTKAFDPVYGAFVTNAAPASAQQVSRTGGTAAGLDNGNFVVVIDDKTSFVAAAGEVATAAIITPTGTIVKGPWLVDAHDIWDNVAAYQGGFAVRVHNLIYFYDNSGNPKGQIDQSVTGRAFDAARGDGTRIAGHINSPFLYLCGSPPGTHLVSLAVFDSRNQSFVTVFDVSEQGFVASTDRAGLASDALDRVVCVWESQPTGYGQPQAAARVLKFDPATKTISPLTSSFWTFINNSTTGGIRAYRMNVSMTTRQICVAAKGEINLQNQPDQGANTPKEVNFFTVFTHPAPADDPTAPLGGFGPVLQASRSGAQITLSWPSPATGFTLESKNSLSDATWTTVGTNNPTVVTVSAGSKFYRLRK